MIWFRLRIIIVSLLFVIFSCKQKEKEKGYKLQKGSYLYELALELSKKIPDLDPEKNKVIIETDNFDITVGKVLNDIRIRAGKRADRMKTNTTGYLKRVIESNAQDIVTNRLLLKAAEKAGIVLDPAISDSILIEKYADFGGKEQFENYLQENELDLEQEITDVKDAAIIKMYLEKKIFDKATVSEDEIYNIYERDVLIDISATIRNLILKIEGKSTEEKQKIRKKMESILERAKKGEDFKKLVLEYSDDPNVKKSEGIVEDIPRRKLPQLFDTAVFSMPIGELSDIIETEVSYHIFKVIERKKNTTTFEQVRSQILWDIKRQKQTELYQKHLEDLKEEVGYKFIPITEPKSKKL